MNEIWDGFINNCKKSIDIGVIRYSLYNLGINILPMIIMIISWVGSMGVFIFSDIVGLMSMLISSVISLVMLIVVMFVSIYCENCSWKAYIHTMETSEKLSFREYFTLGKEGYLKFLGKSLLNVVLPILLISALTSLLYIIPIIGPLAGSFVLVFGQSYLVYRFYSKLLDVSYDDYKEQINNFLLLIIISAILSAIGFETLNLLITVFLVPITLIVIKTKKDKEIVISRKFETEYIKDKDDITKDEE